MKLRRLFPIILVVLLLMPVVGWAAVYYLSPSGSATPPYDTWEKAANNLNQILSLSLTGSNTIYVAEGTYSGSDNYILLNNVKYSNLSIIGRGNKAKIIFNPGTTHSCFINSSDISNVLFKNITIKIEEGSGNAVRIAHGSDIKFVDCNIIRDGSHDGRLVWLYNDPEVTFTCCYMRSDTYEGKTSSIVFRIENDASLTLNYCLVYSPNGIFYQGVFTTSTKNVNINNCIFAKIDSGVCLNNSTSGSLNINNSILLGGGVNGQTSLLWTVDDRRTDGPTNVNNSVVLPVTFYLEGSMAENVNAQSAIIDNPGFKPLGVKGFIIPRVDDMPNVDYALALGDLLEEYGYKGSYFPSTLVASAYADKLRLLVQKGSMELGGHSRTHTPLAYNHALHFEYTGSDSNPTVELDSSRIIHLRTDGSDDVDIDTTQPDADTLGEIISNYNGTNNWTISKSSTDGQQADHISDYLKSEVLAEMPATSAPCDIDFLKETNCEDGNCRGFYKVEIYDPRIELTNLINADGDIIDPQTGQVYETKTFVAPYKSGDESVVEALRTSGYIGAGGIGALKNKVLPYNVFKIIDINGMDLIASGDEEQTTKNAEMFAMNVAVTGLPVLVLTHNESEATLEEWRWILNGFKRAQEAGYNVEVTSLQLAVQALKTLGTYDSSTGDVDIHWPMPSFRLRHDSPCIDAGVKLPIHDSNWRDLAGNRIRYGTAPDIGCYEYKTWPRGAWGMLPWVGNSYKVQWTPYE